MARISMTNGSSVGTIVLLVSLVCLVSAVRSAPRFDDEASDSLKKAIQVVSFFRKEAANRNPAPRRIQPGRGISRYRNYPPLATTKRSGLGASDANAMVPAGDDELLSQMANEIALQLMLVPEQQQQQQQQQQPNRERHGRKNMMGDGDQAMEQVDQRQLAVLMEKMMTRDQSDEEEEINEQTEEEETNRLVDQIYRSLLEDYLSKAMPADLAAARDEDSEVLDNRDDGNGDDNHVAEQGDAEVALLYESMAKAPASDYDDNNSNDAQGDDDDSDVERLNRASLVTLMKKKEKRFGSASGKKLSRSSSIARWRMRDNANDETEGRHSSRKQAFHHQNDSPVGIIDSKSSMGDLTPLNAPIYGRGFHRGLQPLVRDKSRLAASTPPLADKRQIGMQFRPAPGRSAAPFGIHKRSVIEEVEPEPESEPEAASSFDENSSSSVEDKSDSSSPSSAAAAAAEISLTRKRRSAIDFQNNLTTVAASSSSADGNVSQAIETHQHSMSHMHKKSADWDDYFGFDKRSDAVSDDWLDAEYYKTIAGALASRRKRSRFDHGDGEGEGEGEGEDYGQFHDAPIDMDEYRALLIRQLVDELGEENLRRLLSGGVNWRTGDLKRKRAVAAAAATAASRKKRYPMKAVSGVKGRVMPLMSADETSAGKFGYKYICTLY